MADDRPVRPTTRQSGAQPVARPLWSEDRPGEVDWEYLYEHYADSLRRLIARRLPHDGPVDDLLQEVFCRAIRSTPLIDATRAPWPFLATVAGRVVADWWGRESTRRALSAPREHVPERQVTDEFPGSDDHAFALDRMLRVRRALLALTPRHRRALFLYEGADCSYETLVELDPVTPQAMRSLVGRARACFVEQFQRLAVALVVWRRTRLERFSVPLSSEALSVLGGVVVVTLVAGAATLPLASANMSVRTRAAPAPTPKPTGPHSIPPFPASTGRAVTTEVESHESIPPPVVRRLPSGEAQPPDPRSPSLPVEAGGGLTNTPETSTAAFWVVTLEGSILWNEHKVGMETRCDQGQVAARKCEVIRSLPGGG